MYKYTHRAEDQASLSRWQSFLLSDYSDYLACALAGIAVFSKPPNIALMGPLILYTLVKKKVSESPDDDRGLFRGSLRFFSVSTTSSQATGITREVNAKPFTGRAAILWKRHI